MIASGITYTHKKTILEFTNAFGVTVTDFTCCPSSNLVAFKVLDSDIETMNDIISKQDEEGTQYGIYHIKFRKCDRNISINHGNSKNEFMCKFLITNRKRGHGVLRKKRKKEKKRKMMEEFMKSKINALKSIYE